MQQKCHMGPSWHHGRVLGPRGEEWAAQAPGGRRAVGPGGIRRASTSQSQFWFQEAQGPQCFPGVSRDPLSLLGLHEWTGPVRAFGTDTCGPRGCSPPGLSGFTGGAGVEPGWPLHRGAVLGWSSVGPTSTSWETRVGSHWLTGCDAGAWQWVWGVAHL